MLNYSQLRNCYYYDSEVIHISNIKQVQKYINAGVLSSSVDSNTFLPEESLTASTLILSINLPYIILPLSSIIFT